MALVLYKIIKPSAIPLVLLFASLGCDLDGSVSRFRSNVLKTEQHFSALSVKSAAAPLFMKFPKSAGTDAITEISPNQVPLSISTLPIFDGISREDITVLAIGTNELLFMVGSGFGHWGLIVFDKPSNLKPPEAAGCDVISWTNDIFFFRER